MSEKNKQFELKEIRSESELPFADMPLYEWPFYAAWQKTQNRKTRRFVVYEASKPIIYLQAIVYPLIRNINYIYIPYGPVVICENISNDSLRFLKESIKKISTEENAAFARLDFSTLKNETLLSQQESFHENLFKSNFFKAPSFTHKGAYFQPRVEWALDLQEIEQELLSQMHQKTRYSINYAKRKNLAVELIEQNLMDHFDDFYRLTKETAQRDGFHLHPKSYYESVFKTGEEQKNITLVKISYGGEVLVSNIIIYYGKRAMYVYGSSSNNHRNLMPAHLAQWEAIVHAKKRGAIEYNFGGIHTETYPNKNWLGITFFKRNFGGYEIVHGSFYDVVTKPLWYSIYCARKFIKSF